MGLGLHGGGVESARYLAGKGAEVTVTDLRDEKVLAPSIEKLNAFQIRYVLGRHEMEDFLNADMVIMNPGVKPDSPYIKAARRIETDISLFLAANKCEVLAVTGSKGKSTTSSALHYALNECLAAGQNRKQPGKKVWLGGNITISPLSFLDELDEKDTVVLELSSWQLGILGTRDLLKPRAAIITTIMRDHLDRYGTMENYVNDKRLIYRNQDEQDVTVAKDDDWGMSFHRESRGRPLVFSDSPLNEGLNGGWIADPKGPGLARLWEIPGAGSACPGNKAFGSIVEVVPNKPFVPGYHQKKNLLSAALALLDLGIDAELIRDSLGRFPGIEHRLEFFHESAGIRFYNDTAATIPEAAAAAINAFDNPSNIVLVCGGTDKDLQFKPLVEAAANVKAIVLLAGTGTEKLTPLLDSAGLKYSGPFNSMEPAINVALNSAAPGDTVILSPGCSSFGLFLNEFDRGRQWKEGVRRLAP